MLHTASSPAPSPSGLKYMSGSRRAATVTGHPNSTDNSHLHSKRFSNAAIRSFSSTTGGRAGRSMRLVSHQPASNPGRTAARAHRAQLAVGADGGRVDDAQQRRQPRGLLARPLREAGRGQRVQAERAAQRRPQERQRQRQQARPVLRAAGPLLNTCIHSRWPIL